MLIIKHRVNTSKELSELNPKFGVEVDVRTYGERIIVSHDPFKKESEEFKNWISHFKHKTLIINVKEEGLEESINQIMVEYPAINYFYLDQSFPFLVKSLREGQSNTAIRFSNLESIQTLEIVMENLNCKPNWIWIDDFAGGWNHLKFLETINLSGISTCLVSPELQGRNLYVEAETIKRNIHFFKPTAICTKEPEYWERNCIN
jgi:hypothetical protein